jgi:hypothetical protein
MKVSCCEMCALEAKLSKFIFPTLVPTVVHQVTAKENGDEWENINRSVFLIFM